MYIMDLYCTRVTWMDTCELHMCFHYMHIVNSWFLRSMGYKFVILEHLEYEYSGWKFIDFLDVLIDFDLYAWFCIFLYLIKIYGFIDTQRAFLFRVF